MARHKKGTKPAREVRVLDEAHGFGHVEPMPRHLIEEQAESDFAARGTDYEGRHRKSDVDDDEVVAALEGVAA